MKNLAALKTRSQESVAQLVDLGKQQPPAVQQWGVTAAAALAGALALTAVAKGVLGVIGTLAYPPVALTVGALGGGLFGWSYMQRRTPPQASDAQETVAADVAGADVPSSDAPSEAPAEPAS